MGEPGSSEAPGLSDGMPHAAGERTAGHWPERVGKGLWDHIKSCIVGSDIPVAHGGPSRKAGGRMRTRIVRSSGDVYEDLGLSPEEAEHLKARSELMIALKQVIEDRGLTQTAAAELFGVTQPRISNLMRGRIDLFSVDTLISMLAHVGIRVKLVLSKGRKYSVARREA